MILRSGDRIIGIAEIAAIARNRRDRKNQIPAMSAIPGDSGDLHMTRSTDVPI